MGTRKYIIKTQDSPNSTLSQSGVNLEPYISSLNPEQLQAVTTTEGHLLVIAGAGTGKTKTLTYRVSYLVELGVEASSILLLTFTRRAAQEMMTRAATLGDARCAMIQGGTFHGFAHKILRQYAAQIGLNEQFTLLDQSDAAEVIDLVRTELGFNKKEKRFPKKKTLLSIISASINKELPIEIILDSSYPHFLEFAQDIEILQKAFKRYKLKNHLLDFDDLLYELFRLLNDFPDLAHRISSQLRYIMVDEYQDTNLIQAKLVKELAKVHQNLMVVGDDAQSIYSFRGANYRNILDFPAQYNDCIIVKLETNYRSTQKILDLSNFLINQAKKKFAKRLLSHQNEPCELPAIVSAPDEAFQSQFVVQRMLELREEGVALRDISVLMRNSRDSYRLEVELSKANIPYVKYGGQKVVEAAHVKDFMAYLRVFSNPNDMISWNRILQLLDGVGPKTAASLMNWIKASNSPYKLTEAKISSKYIASLRALSALFDTLSQPDNTLPAMADSVYGYYHAILKSKYVDDYPKREKDLENFLNIVQNYTSLNDLLSDLALDPMDLTAVETLGTHKDEDPVVLSTIHSAKGLEWHTVFLINTLDGIIPSRYAVLDHDQLDEELRLLYVALTRAKRELYISYPIVQKQRGDENFMSNPSRFISKLPEHLFDRLLLIQETASGREPSLPKPGPINQLSDKNQPESGKIDPDDLPF
jgi:DNA helicase-2/ATP-dependent DNA helicase PcrA